MFAVVEKKNPLSIHGLFDTKEGAERHISEVIPEYVRRRYFMDKTLTADDFTVRQN